MTFIVFEGLDGAGTTTQAKMLSDLLSQNHSVLLTKQPSDGPIGKMIRKMLSREIERTLPSGAEPIDRDTLALMYAADRLDHLATEVEPAIQAGQVVISDRYYGSSFAYQGEDLEDGFSYEWVKTLNSRARQPDLTIFLEAPGKICFERITQRDTTKDIFENLAFLEKLEPRYQKILRDLEAAGERIVTLDGTGTIEGIHEQVKQEVAKVLP